VPQEPISIIKLQEQVLEMEKAEQQKKLSWFGRLMEKSKSIFRSIKNFFTRKKK
jgi:hypothetical protein